MTRIAVLNEDKCKVKKCNSLCVSFCPMVRSKVEAIRVEGSKAIISETLCSGCGICVKKCPFKAISIVNLPTDSAKTVSNYSASQCPRRERFWGYWVKTE